MFFFVTKSWQPYAHFRINGSFNKLAAPCTMYDKGQNAMHPFDIQYRTKKHITMLHSEESTLSGIGIKMTI